MPDGSRDLEVERALLLENGYDELSGVDFAKGCYMGQELTSRTKHRALLLENVYHELRGVDLATGCYMGQELTSRTKHRALIRKRLLPVSIQGPAPAPGTPVLRQGAEAGEMRSSVGDVGLALLRLDAVRAGGELSAGDAVLRVHTPDWAVLPEAG